MPTNNWGGIKFLFIVRHTILYNVYITCRCHWRARIWINIIWYRKNFGFYNGGMEAIESDWLPLYPIIAHKTGYAVFIKKYSNLIFIKWFHGFCHNLSFWCKERTESSYCLTVWNPSQPKIINHYKLNSCPSIKTLKDKAIGKIYPIGVWKRPQNTLKGLDVDSWFLILCLNQEDFVFDMILGS